MAGGSSSVGWLQLGKTTAVATAPGAYYHSDWQGEGLPDCTQNKIDITTERDDGEHAIPQLGVKSGGISFDVLIRGKGTAQGDGEASDPPEDLEAIFDCVFGSNADPTSADTTGASNTTTVLNFADTSNWAVGDGVQVDTDSTSAFRHECRQVITVTTDTSITVDRALTAAPADSSVISGATNWHLDADNHLHPYLWIDREGEDWRRMLKGCSVALTLGGDNGGLLRGSVTCQANDWSYETEAEPTYSATTTSPGLLVAGAPFYIGNSAYECVNFQLDCGVSYQPRDATSGTNGLNGWIAQYSPATIQTRLYHESVGDVNLQAWEGAGASYDIGVQFGNPASNATKGSALYIRMPAAVAINPRIVSHNGVDVIEVTWSARRPSSGRPSLSLHLYGKAA